MKRILVVSAHPGEAVLGCGGTISQLSAQGCSIRVLVLGDGWSSRVKSFEKAMEVIDLDALEDQERNALKLIGVSQVDFLRLPDNRFDNFPLLDLVKHVEKAKHSFKPDVVFTNSRYDLGVDEQRTCQAVVTAFRPLPGDNATTLYSFESPSSSEWNYGNDHATFSPNFFVDISTTLDNKLASLEALKSEMRSWPHPRSVKAVEHLAKWRGASVGTDAAEAFLLLRSVRTVEQQGIMI